MNDPEDRRGDHIIYTTAEGIRGSRVIVWVQAPFESIGANIALREDVYDLTWDDKQKDMGNHQQISIYNSSEICYDRVCPGM